MLKEFKEFALKGSVLDMAIGIVIGGAFTPIVKSLVDDVLMPPLGLLLGRVDFTNLYFVPKSGGSSVPVESSRQAVMLEGRPGAGHGTEVVPSARCIYAQPQPQWHRHQRKARTRRVGCNTPRVALWITG